MMPELETLGQLQGGDLPLEIILHLSRDVEAFKRGVMGLIACGDVRLLTSRNIEVPACRHRKLFVDGIVMQEIKNLRLSITEQGASQIAWCHPQACLERLQSNNRLLGSKPDFRLLPDSPPSGSQRSLGRFLLRRLVAARRVGLDLL